MIKCSVKNSSDPSMKDLRWGRVESRKETVPIKGPDKRPELEKYWKKQKGGHEVVGLSLLVMSFPSGGRREKQS